MRDIFGEEYAFRAGNVGTAAAKAAYGFVKGHERDYGSFVMQRWNALLKVQLVKRTTGQHLGELLFLTTWMFTTLRRPASSR